MSSAAEMGEAIEGDQISLRYDGGTASRGMLHLYEYGRAQYAFSRFIVTVEHFRRTGRVLDRVNAKNYVEVLISSPEKGSFLQDVFVEVAVNAAATAINLPLSALFAYVWQLLNPLSGQTEATLQDVGRSSKSEDSSSQGDGSCANRNNKPSA